MSLDEITASLERYVQHGIPPGSFLRSVLENDLFSAVGEIALRVYNTCPASSYGSPETVQRWLNEHAERRKQQEGKSDAKDEGC